MRLVRSGLLPLCLAVLASCSDGGDSGTLPGGGGAAATLTVKDSAVETLEDQTVEIKLDVTASAGAPEIVITGQPAHGKLAGKDLAYTYTPAADFNGVETLTFSAKLGDKEVPGKVTITVKPVNDAPVFTAGGDVTVNEDAGPQVSLWASAIKGGPDDEAAQKVAFTVTTDNAALFAAAPAVDAGGKLSFTPAADVSGLATVTVIAKDDGGTADGGVDAAAAQTFTLTVLAVNDAPAFTPGALNVSVAEDSGLYVAPWASAIDPGALETSQAVTFSVTAVPTNLFAVAPAVGADGMLTFMPAADANGTASVTVRAWDSGGTALGGQNASGATTFAVTVTPVNDPPSFTGAGTVTVAEDSGAYSGAWVTSLSKGPADESSQSVTYAVSAVPASLFAVQPSVSGGTLTFTPAANANGSATVTIEAFDSGGGQNRSGTQTFTITVSPVNDAPSFTGSGTVTVAEDSGAYAGAWVASVSKGPADESSQTVTYAVSAVPASLFAVQPAINGAGTLTFTPAANANGSATVTVEAFDSGGGQNRSGTQTFTITVTPVNDPPAFTGSGTVTVAEDSGAYSGAWVASLSKGPADEAAQTVTYAVSAVPASLFAVQPAVGAGGTLTFTPAADANGSATVTIEAFDSGGGQNRSGTQTFTIIVSPVNDAPAFTGAGTVTVAEDSGAYSAAWIASVSKGPADEAAQTVTYAVSAVPAGNFAVAPAISAAGTLTFTPAADANGSATVTVRAFDSGGTALGGVNASGAQTFTITLTPVNDAPGFTPGPSTVAVGEDSGAYSAAWASAVLAGPANESAQNVTFAVSAAPASLFATQPAVSASGTLTFTPAADANGSATVTVRAWDDGGTALGGTNASGTQTFTITVNAVNDAPSFTPGGAVMVNEDAGAYSAAWASAISAGPANESAQGVTFAVSASAAGLFSVAPAVSASGTLTFTPAADANGSATITVRAWDDGGTALGGANASGTQTFTITVNAVNDAPGFTAGASTVTVNEDAGAYSGSWATAVAAGPADESAQGVTFAVAASPTSLFSAQPALSASGTLTFTPAANKSGSATITVRAWDGGGTALGGVNASGTQTFTITVNAVNDAPGFTPGAGTVSVNEDTGAYAGSWATAVSAGPADESAQGVTFAVVASPASLFSTQPAVSASGTLTFTPAADKSGSATVTVRAWDDGGTAFGGTNASSVQTFTITVNAVNDAPGFTPGASTVAVNEDSGAYSASWATAVAAGPADESAQAVTFAVSAAPSNLFATQPAVSASGTLTFTPNANANGSATVTVRAWDDGGTALGGVNASGTQTFTITVNAVNDAPGFTAGAGTIAVNEDSGVYSAAWATAISSGPANESAQSVTFAVSAAPASLFATPPALSASGTLTFTPNANANGSATVSVRAWDDGGTAGGGTNASGTQTFTITVGAVNDAPGFTAGAGTVTVNEDAGGYSAAWATGVSAGPADESAQAVTFAVSAAPASLFAAQPALSPSGTLMFTPAANMSGSATVTVRAWDDGGTAGGGANASGTQTFTITVNPVNDAPGFLAGAGTVTVGEDSGAYTAAWATAISAGPADEAAQGVTFSVAAVPASLFSAQPALNAGGTLTFTPAANMSGSATVTVRAWDDGGTALGGANASGAQTFTITVSPVNDPPVYTSGAGTVSVNEDAGAYSAAWATAVAPGPIDESAQSVTFAVSAAPSNLFATQPALSPSGTLTFTPAADANGSATITLRAWDSGGAASAVATFTISVGAVNDAPGFTAGAGTITVGEDSGAYTAAWATAISAGPANESAQGVTFAVAAAPASLFGVQPALSADGTLTFTPAADANGSATITVRAWDDGGTSGGGVRMSGTQTFTIAVTPVNDPPRFTAGPNKFVLDSAGAQSFGGWATGIAPGPVDELAQSYSFAVTNDANGLFDAQPALANDGTLTFTPKALQAGTATVWVVMTDSLGASTTRSFLILVDAINDAPSFTPGGDVTVSEDAGAYSAAWATGITPGAGEAGQAIDFQITANSAPGLFDVAPAVSAAGVLTFTAKADASGSAVITLVLHDDGGTTGGGVDISAPATFTITVTPVNDAPSFVAGGGRTLPEDAGPQSFANWAFAMSAGPADEAGQTFAFAVTTSAPALFAAAPTVNTAGTFSFTPAANANGTAVVYVELVDDGGARSAKTAVAVAITPVNDAPVFAKGPGQTVFEDAGAVSVAGWATGIATGPANEASQSVTTYVVTDNPGLFAVLPAVGLDGKLTYTPAADKYGVANVTLRLVDDGGTANGGANVSPPQSFSIYVVGVNDAPSFAKGADVSLTEDPGPQSIAGWATAISGGPLNEAWQMVSFQVTTATPALFDGPVAVETDGTLSFRTMPDANGTAAVYVRAVDNGGTAGGGVNATSWQSFTIDVAPVNDPPRFKPGPNKYVLDTAGAQSFPGWATLMEAGPADESAQTYGFTVTNDANTLFTVQPALALDGTLTLTPAVGASGTANLWVTMTDSGGAATVEIVSVTVDALNDAPSFTAGADVTVNEDAGMYYAPWASGLSAGPGELTQSLSFEITANTNPGLFLMPPAIGTDGALFVWPAINANGTAALTVVLRDDGGTAGGGVDTSAPVTLTLTVTPVNDPPSFMVGPNPSGMEDDAPQTRAGFAVLNSLGAPDEAAQTVTYAVMTDRPALFAAGPAIDSAGTLTYTPAPDANGMAHVTAIAYDDGGTALGGTNASQPRSFDVVLNAKNDPPVVVTTGDFSIDEGDPLHKGDGMPFITTLLTGPADEAWQYFYGIEVTSSNPSLVGCAYVDGMTHWLHFCAGGDNSGTAVLYLSVRDSGGTMDGGMDTTLTTVTVTVNPVPDAPHAQDDYVSTAIDMAAWVCVTCNDWDPDSAAVTVATLSPPAHGTATSNGSSVQYTPAPGYTGADSFSYSVSDGTLFSSAVVHVWVGPDVTPPHFLAAASRPANGSLLNGQARGPGGALNPALFVFDDPYLDRGALTYGVTFNGMPLIEGTHFWTDWLSESDRVGLRIGDNFPIPDQGGLLTFHLGNVKDTLGNTGSDVSVAVWWDPVAPRAQLSGTWGVNARIIALFSEPMSTATSASLVFGVPSLGLTANPDPVNGEGWFSMATTNDAYYFVPDAPFPSGVTIAGSVANFTDLAGNRVEGQNSFSSMPCCSNYQSLRLLAIRFVDPVSGTTVFAGDLAGAADRTLVVPNALAGGETVVEAQFDTSLQPSMGGSSELQGNEMSPNSLRVNGMYKTTALANDTLVFNPRSADPAFVWRGRDTYRVRLEVQAAPSPSNPSGSSSYHGEWRLLLQAGPEDVTAPAIVSSGAVRGAGAVPTVRPEEPVRLAFSETVDPRDLTSANFTITSAGGTWPGYVEGDWGVPSAGVRAIDPSTSKLVALAPGAYTLTVQPLRDVSVSENASPARSFPFVVAPAAGPAPQLLRFATPGTNVSLPLTFSFSDRMSPASFTDYGPPAQRGFALEEKWGTTWIPFKGLTAGDKDRVTTFPGNVVELRVDGTGLTEQKQYRLRWLGVTNIDGVPLTFAPDVTFSAGRYGWPQRPRPELDVKGQEFVAGAQTLMGMPIESSLGFSAQIYGGCCYGPSLPWALTVAAPGGVEVTSMSTSSSRSVELGAAQLDALFGYDRAAYAVSVTDSAGQDYTIVGDLYRLTQAVLTDAQPVVTAPGVNGPGTFTAYGQINDVDAAAHVQRVALVLVVGDTTAYPPQWVDVIGFRMTEMIRNADGSLSYRLDSPPDQPLPALPPPYAYSLAPVLDTPSPMGSDYESMAIGVGSAPFNP